jgi:hypothetical protein
MESDSLDSDRDYFRRALHLSSAENDGGISVFEGFVRERCKTVCPDIVAPDADLYEVLASLSAADTSAPRVCGYVFKEVRSLWSRARGRAPRAGCRAAR